MEEKLKKGAAGDDIRPGVGSEGRAPEVAPEPPSPEQLLTERDSRIAELEKELLYQRAEFENFRKRTEKRYRDALEFATEPLVKDLLPVLDNLERAIDHSREAGPESLSALLEGVEHVAGQFHQALTNHGVEHIQAGGEKFDPNLHESLTHVPGVEDNRVAEVYQKGYLLKGRLLRPAKVAVSKVATVPDDG